MLNTLILVTFWLKTLIEKCHCMDGHFNMWVNSKLDLKVSINRTELNWCWWQSNCKLSSEIVNFFNSQVSKDYCLFLALLYNALSTIEINRMKWKALVWPNDKLTEVDTRMWVVLLMAAVLLRCLHRETEDNHTKSQPRELIFRSITGNKNVNHYTLTFSPVYCGRLILKFVEKE
jgi:hypothetical protein